MTKLHARMRRQITSAIPTGIIAVIFSLTAPASAQWVSFVNETSTRMPVGPGLNTAGLSTTDPKEKDYAWGDVDGDGDLDLVCVRKQPFTSSGRDPNVLFMNEGIAEGHALNGVLVDRTAQYAAATLETATWDDPQNPAGALPDQGFLTWTNDRDVVLFDVDNDGWLDIITATTLSAGAPKYIGHPRVYINLREVGGVWQGFRHEPDRIPTMHSTQPRFCSVAAGDVTGDGYADLYFGDYDSGGSESYDYNNKLLINQGASNPGFFTDSGNARMSANPGLQSAFGAASVIADMNGDGKNDVVKQTSLASPTHVAVQHNNPANVGFFPDATYKMVDTGSPYFVSAGDLNNDGRLDLIVTDDGDDKYRLNTGNAGDGTANFNSFIFSFTKGDDDGFGSQSIAEDLDNDGWRDVLISDVDVDIGGCTRRLHIYHNLANVPPGGNVTMREQDVAGLNNDPANMSGTHNVAVLDINGDGWKDLVIGRCSGTAVWMNTGVTFFAGPETFIADTSVTIEFDAEAHGATTIDGSLKIHISQNGGPFVQQNLAVVDADTYSATFLATPCGQNVRYYFTGQMKSTGGTQVHSFVHPYRAPAENFVAVAGTDLMTANAMEGSVAGWTVASDTGVIGAWEAVDPVGTSSGGTSYAPEHDATPYPGERAFITLNATISNALNPGSSDVDGGSTRLTSPVIDLAGTDATITYARWFVGAAGSSDSLTTEVSANNGAAWTLVHSVTSGSAGWQTASFLVSDYVKPSAQVRVRFTATDGGAASTVEGGIDDFRVDEMLCTVPCKGDLAPDGVVDVNDLLALIGAWGAAGGSADLNEDGTVDVNDLLILIGGWGPCP